MSTDVSLAVAAGKSGVTGCDSQAVSMDVAAGKTGVTIDLESDKGVRNNG